MRLTGSRFGRAERSRRPVRAQWAPRLCLPETASEPARETASASARESATSARESASAAATAMHADGAAGVALACEDWHSDPMAGLTRLAAAYGGPGSLPRLMDASALDEFARSALGVSAPAEIDTRVLLESRSTSLRRRGVALVSAGRAVVAFELAGRRHDAGGAGGAGDGSEDLDLSLDVRGEVVVTTVPTAALPVLWLRWAGPLHTDDGAGSPVRDVAAIDRRVRDAGEPVPDESAALAAMWAGQWREWSLRDEASGLWLRYVSVPGHGVYTERPVKGTGGVESAPRPSGLVWGDIVRAYCALSPVRAAAGNQMHW